MMKIGVCIRAKDEQKIICDWVSHYLKLGFDKIFIYDNLSEPSIETTLKSKNLFSDKITIKIDNVKHSNQPIIYQECIDQNKELDWLFLCDADEFLWLKEGTVKEFLLKFSEDTCTVLINWLVYGTSSLQTYDNNKSVFEQFILREEYSHFWNTFVKSFIRPQLINKFGNVHITQNNNFVSCDVYGNTINVTYKDPDKCDRKDKYLSGITPLIIVHYMTLDFESMNEKYIRNHDGWLLEESCNKYSLKWYKSKFFGFADNIKDLRMVKYDYCQYICNLTRKTFYVEEKDKHREGVSIFGSNSRIRALVYVMTRTLFGKCQILCNIAPNKNIKGIGMSDGHTLALKLTEKFNYKNTFYHKEPFLDIYNLEHIKIFNNLDFIISSDVFEHISPYPDLQAAFNNLYKMLNSGGYLIFSVPFIYDNYYEHFPTLYDYSINYNKETEKYYIKNKTIDGKEEILDKGKTPSGETSDLCFHGGPGSTLEMRIFSQDVLIKHLKDAGFQEITFYDPNEIIDMQKYGIFWENKCSLVLSAKK